MQNYLKNKNLTVGISAVIGVAVLAGVLALTGIFTWSDWKKIFSGKESVIEESDAHLMASREAYDIALLKAREWQADARLAYMNADSISKRGRSNIWKLIFISEKSKRKGFLIELEDYKIILADEISYSGIGAEFPVNILSSEDAIKMVRAMKGYEDVEIYGVEVINMRDLWYWGVKTSKGVMSVKGGK